MKYRDRIADYQFLVDNQCLNGQWSYGAIPSRPTADREEKTRDGALGQQTWFQLRDGAPRLRHAGS